MARRRWGGIGGRGVSAGAGGFGRAGEPEASRVQPWLGRRGAGVGEDLGDAGRAGAMSVGGDADGGAGSEQASAQEERGWASW